MPGRSDPPIHQIGASGQRGGGNTDDLKDLTGRTLSSTGLVIVDPWLATVLGLLAGLAFAGWAMSGDLLLNWDQVIGERIPIPPGFFGEGPELPRRMPLYVLLSVVSRVVPGPLVVALLLVGSTVAAVVGVHRQAGNDVVAVVVALGYGVSPFILTRAAVGHLPVVVAAAMIPWALDAFSSRDRRKILIWAAAFGLTGPSGAIIGLVPAVLAIVWPSQLEPGAAPKTSTDKKVANVGRAVGDLGLMICTQVSWLVPGLIVLAGEGSFPSSPTDAFATRANGVAGVFRVGAGGGFFIDPEDVANRSGAVAAVLGVLLVAGGVGGLVARRQLDLSVKSAAVAGLMILASIEGVGSIGWQQLTAMGPFGVARDAQKFWPLVGFALAIGLAQLFRRMLTTTSRSLVLALVGVLAALQFGAAWPGLFGADGRLVANEAPAPWVAIEQALARPTTRTDASEGESLTVALPWVRYERLDLSGDRNVLQPAPWLLSNRVLVSGDPGLGAGNSERNDTTSRRMVILDLAVRSGADIAPELKKLGVTHVLISGSVDAGLYERIGNEEGVQVLVADDNYLLYQLGPKSSTIDTIGPTMAKNSRFRSVLAGGPTVLVVLFIAFGAFQAISSYVRQFG